MRWVLSTSSAPDASLAELLDAIDRKRLQGLELVQGHAHGVEPWSPVRIGETKPRGPDWRLAAYRIEEPDTLDPYDVSQLAKRLDVPVVLARPGWRGSSSLERWIEAFDFAKGTLLLAVKDPADIQTSVFLAPRGGCRKPRFAWDVTLLAGAADQARWMLETLGSDLRHVRIPGTGPEALQEEDGRIGSLVSMMTLLGYRGTAALAPSAPSRVDLWTRWLARPRGWGCGRSTVVCGPAERGEAGGTPRSHEPEE